MGPDGTHSMAALIQSQKPKVDGGMLMPAGQ